MRPGHLLELPGVQPDRIGSCGDGTLDRLTNPPDCIRRQPRFIDDVETVDCHQQRAKAFLDQVADGQAVSGIATGDMYDEAQVRKHQLARGIQIVFRSVADGQLVFFLAREHGDAADAIHVRVEAPERPRQGEV